MIKRFLAYVWASMFFLIALPAWAAPVTFDLSGTLNGASASGFITVDDQTNAILSWTITVAAGPTDDGNNTLSAFVFSDEDGSSALSNANNVNLRETSTQNPFAPQGSNDNRDFRISPGVAEFLPNNGGTVGITDCWNCSPFRTGTATLTPRAPSPGVIEFTAPEISEPETGIQNQFRDVVVTLQRVGGSAGAVSVTVSEGSPGDATSGVDYVAIQPTVISWADGDSSDKQFIVTFIDDFLDETDEFFELALGNVTGGATLGNTLFTSVTILNDDFSAQPALVGFNLANTSVAENVDSLDVQIDYDPNGLPVGQIQVDVATVANTASEGDDYVGVSTTVSFAFDVANTTINVPIINDALAEGTENFSIELSNPRGTDQNGQPLDISQIEFTNATIAVDITDDEVSVAPSIDNASFCTGTNGFEFDLQVSGTTGIDYALRFSGDNTAFSSPTERFEVNFDTNGTITRVQPGVSTFGAPSFDRWQDGPLPSTSIVALGNNSYRVTGVIPHGADTLTTQDTVAQVGLRTFTTGSSSSQATSSNVPIAACSGQTQATGELNFDAANLNIDENITNGSLTFTLTRSGGSSGDVDVTVTSVAGTATENTDYAAINEVVSWEDGDSVPKTVTIDAIVTDDADAEPDETFTLTLSNATQGVTLGNVSEQIITIVDDDGVGPSAGADEQADGPIGEDVQITFGVDGIFPITLTADLGTLSPNTLTQAGDVVYTVAVPTGANAGDALDDTIVLTDANNDIAFKDIRIDIVASAAGAPRNLSDISNLTPNQRQMARALDSLCPQLLDLDGFNDDQADLATKCVSLRDDETTNDQVRTALDALMPEELTVLATSALRLSAFQHGNLEERINALRSGATGIDLAGLDIEIQGQQIPGSVVAEVFENLIGGAAGSDDFDRWGLFVDGKLKWGEKDDTDYESAFDFDVMSLTFGADYRIKDNFIVGGALSWGMIDADFDNGAEFEIDSWNASAFGTFFSEGYYLDALLTYGQNDYDTERRIAYTDMAGSYDLNAFGSTDGYQLSAGLSGGFDFNHGPFTIGPHIGTYRMRLEVDSFNERGATGLNMAIGDQSAESFTINAGLHASYVFTPKWGVLIPHVRIDSVFELEDNAEQVTVGFAADPFRRDPRSTTPTIRLRTDQADAQYYILNTGVSAQFIHGISGFVNYQYTSSLKNWEVEDVTWGLRWERSF